VRIRSVKPEFMEDEKLNDLESAFPRARPMLTFAGLWMASDKQGVFPWNPRVLHLHILPLVKGFCIEKALSVLECSELIRRFEVDGKVYGHVVNFERHQRINGKEAQEDAKYPKPCKYLPIPEEGEASGKQLGSNGEAVETTEGKGKEGKGKEIAADAASADLSFYHRIEKGFLDRNGGKFTDYGKEGKAIHGLIAKARARDAPQAESLLASVCTQFWKLKHGTDKFWCSQPFTPSALNCSAIWDRVLESMRNEEIDPDILAIVRRQKS
jgi:hypothetical protein